MHTLPLPKQLFTCPSGVNASYTLTVELKSYENPSHMRAQSNDCCDGNCSNPCDNRFRFCFTDDPDNANSAGVLLTRPEEAVIGCQFATDVISMDNDDITFPSSKTLGGNAENPLEFNGDIWPVRFNTHNVWNKCKNIHTVSNHASRILAQSCITTLYIFRQRVTHDCASILDSNAKGTSCSHDLFAYCIPTSIIAHIINCSCQAFMCIHVHSWYCVVSG